MLQVGTWKDRENPPQNPVFGYNGKSQTKTPSLTEALSSVAEGLARALRSPTPSGNQSPPTSSRAQLNEMGVSPSKCASLQSQYIVYSLPTKSEDDSYHCKLNLDALYPSKVCIGGLITPANSITASLGPGI